ncbi:MAG: hypothetical protein WBM50_07700 [Acidimicrobiales bacterium]
MHQLRGHGPLGEALEELDRIEFDGMRITEERVELGLDADDCVETSAAFPLFEEIGDARQRVTFGLQP